MRVTPWKIYAGVVAVCAAVNTAIFAPAYWPIKAVEEPIHLPPQPEAKAFSHEDHNMPSVGPIQLDGNTGSPVVSQSGAGAEWTSGPGGDWFETATSVGSGGSTKLLTITNPAPTFPPGAALTGVFVRCVTDTDDYASVVYDLSFNLVVGGAVVGNNKARSTNWGDVDGEYGGEFDKWGVSDLDIDDVTAENFGIAVAARRPSDGEGGNYPRLLGIEFTFYYTEEEVTMGTADGTLPGFTGSATSKILGSGGATLPGLTGKAHHRVN